MAKERAARRAERERLAAARAGERAREAARAERKRSVLGKVRRLFPSSRRRPDSVLANRRRVQNRSVAAVFVLVQVLGWLLARDLLVSLGVLVLTGFALPVVFTLAFDRRG